MTSATHTPGSWKAVYSEYGEEIWFGGNDGPGMWEIEGAEAYLPGDHDEQARLIAAAPDLLAALDQVDAYLSPFDGEEDAYAEIRSVIQQAIAKATGQDVP